MPPYKGGMPHVNPSRIDSILKKKKSGYQNNNTHITVKNSEHAKNAVNTLEYRENRLQRNERHFPLDPDYTMQLLTQTVHDLIMLPLRAVSHPFPVRLSAMLLLRCAAARGRRLTRLCCIRYGA